MVALTHIQEARKALSMGSIPIALSEMERCFDVLSKSNFKPLHIKELHKDFINCSGRFHESKKHELNGTSTFSISEESKNKIRETLLYLIYKLEDLLKENSTTIKQVNYKLNEHNSNTSTLATSESQRNVDVEIIINRKFQEYSVEDQGKLLNAIANLLSMDSGEIKIKSIKPGSVKVTLSLPFGKAKLLEEKINSGALNEYDVVSFILLKKTSSRENIINSYVYGKKAKFFSQKFSIFLGISFIISIIISLIDYHWIFIVAAILLLVVGRAFYLYTLKKLVCVRCNGAGTLAGEDPISHMHFHSEEPCYMCNGKKIPPKDRRLWNNIAKKAVQKLSTLEVQEESLLQEVEQLRKSMKFSINTDEQIVLAHNDILNKKYKQLVTIESELEAYLSVYKQAFINAFHIHLLQILNRERIEIEQRDIPNLDTMSDSLNFVQDGAFLQQHAFKSLLEQHLVSESMRKDIDTALIGFQTFILKHKEK